MRTRSRLIAGSLSLACLSAGATQAHADQNSDALNAIADTADRICGTVAAAGSSQNTDVTGDVRAQLKGLAKYLADLGISGTGSINSDEYVGVLRSDLPSTLNSTRDCKLKVFDKLEQKLIIGGGQQGMAAPQGTARQGKPSAQSDKTHSDPRSSFGADAIRIKGKEVIVSNCGVGGCGVSVRFSLENASGISFSAALRRGAISVGPCTDVEASSSGLPYALGAGVKKYSNWVDPAQPRLFPAGSRIDATIGTLYSTCTEALNGVKATDLSIAIAITVSSETFDLPLSVEAIPVRWASPR